MCPVHPVLTHPIHYTPYHHKLGLNNTTLIHRNKQVRNNFSWIYLNKSTAETVYKNPKLSTIFFATKKV